ncbi:MAG: FkbM family methyltransferase [Candidatus Sericytochromatia bacterium]
MNINQTFNQKMSMAVREHQNGNYAQAENMYMNILSEYPNQPDVLHLLGVACSQLEKYDKALNYLNMSIIFNPNNPDFYCNLGETHNRLNNYTEAENNFKKAISIAPNSSIAYYNLANTLRKLNKDQDALDLYKQAIKINPNNPDFYYNLGNLYRDLGMFKTAIETYQKALKLNNNMASVHNNLAATYVEWDENEKAIFHYLEAIKLNPEFLEAYNNISGMYNKICDIEKASYYLDKLEYYKEQKNDFSDKDAIELAKDSMFYFIPQSNEYIDKSREKLFRTLDEINIDNFDFETLKRYELYPPSNLTYQGRDNKELKEKYYSKFKGLFTSKELNFNNEKPHIAFVVTHGHEGVFMKCMAGLINNISKEKFKISIVCSKPNGEKILRPVITSPEVNYISIPHDLKEASDILYSQKIDILHYWEIGTDSINYFLPYMKCAKIQCTSWGWPDTSGNPNIDYFISCENFETENSQKHYTEKLIKLKNLPVFYYKRPVQVANKKLKDFSLSENYNYYLCAQNLRKVHPDFDKIVSGIIEKDPKAIVLFIDDKQKNVTDLLNKRITENYPNTKNKIKFLSRMTEVDYLSLLKNMKVLIDSTYYTGGANTNYDAFAVGKPVVTLPTEYHRGRYTTAVYEKMGIYDCIAKNIEDYVDISVKIANDDIYRDDLTKRILNKSAQLFEDMNAVKELEDCFYYMLGKDSSIKDSIEKDIISNKNESTLNIEVKTTSEPVIETEINKSENIVLNQESQNNTSINNMVFVSALTDDVLGQLNSNNSKTQVTYKSSKTIEDSINNQVISSNIDISGFNNTQKIDFKVNTQNLLQKQLPSLESILGIKVLIDIVDIGAANVDQDPIYKSFIDSKSSKVIGFEPNLKALEMLNEAKTENELYLPYVIGDGKTHTINFCEAYGMSSILKPDYKSLDNFNYFSDWSKIYKQIETETKRIDDIEEIKNIDYIKLDIQGGELLVLENSKNKLKDCMVIQTEVFFVPMYENQPYFSDIDSFLRAQGFVLHTLFDIFKRYLKPLEDPNSMFAGLNQVMQSDAVYIKDFNNLENYSNDKLLKLATIMHDIYKSYDLVLKTLIVYDNKNKTNYSNVYLNTLKM